LWVRREELAVVVSGEYYTAGCGWVLGCDDICESFYSVGRDICKAVLFYMPVQCTHGGHNVVLDDGAVRCVSCEGRKLSTSRTRVCTGRPRTRTRNKYLCEVRRSIRGIQVLLRI
jgi:hypothetical protein